MMSIASWGRAGAWQPPRRKKMPISSLRARTRRCSRMDFFSVLPAYMRSVGSRCTESMTSSTLNGLSGSLRAATRYSMAATRRLARGRSVEDDSEISVRRQLTQQQ